MIKLFIKDSLIYAIPSILSRGIAILLLPIYTSIATASEIGVLELFIAFSTFISIFLSVEIYQGIARFIPELENVSLKKEFASTGLLFIIAMFSLALTLVYIFSDYFSFYITKTLEYNGVFKIFIIYIFFHALFFYLQSLLRFEGKPIEFSIISIVYATVNVIAILTLENILKLQMGLFSIVFSMLISAVFSVCLSFYFLRGLLSFKFKVNILKKLLIFTIPLVPAAIFTILTTYVDRFMVSQYLDLESVGFYSIALKLASSVGLILMGFQMAITPILYKYYKQRETPLQLAIVFRYFVFLVLLYFISFSFFIRDILYIFTTEEYYSVGSIVSILVLSLVFSGLYLFFPGISLYKKTYIILIINIVGFLLNILLNYILINLFGLLGVSLATLTSFFLVFLLYVFFSQRLYFVKHKWLPISLIALFSFFLVLCHFFYFSTIEMEGALIFKGVSFVLFIFFSFKLKIIEKKDFSFFKKE